MDIAGVAASLAHDTRFDALVAYLREKIEGDTPAAPVQGEEVIPSSATQSEGLIERAEDKVVEIFREVEGAVVHAFDGDQPEPPVAA